MIIRKCDDYFLIRVSNDMVKNINIFDMESIKELFKSIIDKLRKKYDLHGLVDVDVYVNNSYGMIIEMRMLADYFDEIDMKIKMHLNSLFLTEISSNDVLDYEDVYYYRDKFYGNYLGLVDSNIIYKDTDDIISKGIKLC